MPRLSRDEIRRTRLHPRRSDYLYLHLSRLRDAVRAELGSIRAADVLDVYCGARPYEPLLDPTARCVGLDVEDAYGCADVVSTEFLPFPDASFDLCLCTQAFQYIPEPGAAVEELRRVLRPGGEVVITIPAAYPGDPGPLSPAQLRELFRGWDRVTVETNGGTVVTLVTRLAIVLNRLERTGRGRLRPLLAVTYWSVNCAGDAVDFVGRRVESVDRLRPLNLVVRARRPP